MGILSGLMGNASEVDAQALEQLLGEVVVPGETIEKAFQMVRDTFVFTNKRLILVDRQGMSGKKTEFMSIPYSKLTMFSMETAGTFDMDSELKIWVGSNPSPIAKQFKRGTNIKELYALLSRHAL